MPESRPSLQRLPAASRWRPLLLALLTGPILPRSAAGADSRWVENLAFWAWHELDFFDARLQTYDRDLAALAEPLLINSNSRIGLKTGYTTEEDVRWFELSLKQPGTADCVVLVPPLAKAATAVVAGFGFPVRFKLEVFDPEGRATVVIDQTGSDFPNPGCSPVIARFSPRVVSRVRFTATDPWSVDGPEILAMAETLVLSGDRNLALEATVTSSSSRNAPVAWTRGNLVDMITPLGLPVAPQAGTLGFHSAVADQADTVKTLTLTLPEAVPLDELRLIPARRKDVPLWFDYGFPAQYQIEAATRPDFSDAVLLHEARDRTRATPGMNLVCIPTHGVVARYVRLTAKELWYRKSDFVFALAEFQAFSNGVNVAPRGTFSASDQWTGEDGKRWSLEALHDGLTEGGRLIPLTDWFTQLETRQRLAQERALLSTRRDALLARSQQQLVMGSVGGAGLITLLSGFMLWRQQRQRRRDARRLRDKLARDLHDEIGSNLGSITLICSIASQPGATPDSLRADIAEIERVAAETADSMRDMVDLMSSRGGDAEADWFDVLHRLTERLLRGVTLDCAVPAAPLPTEPDPETRRELYLFCKEVLHNIARHAQATRVRFHLTPIPSGLRVEIRDNGCGFDPGTPASGHGLGNLRERASVLKARLQIVSEPGAGTAFTLEVPRGPRWSKRLTRE